MQHQGMWMPQRALCPVRHTTTVQVKWNALQPIHCRHNVKARNDESVQMVNVEEEYAFEQCLDQEGEHHEEEDVPEYLEDEWD